MTFHIRTYRVEGFNEFPEFPIRGEIAIGKHIESFPLVTSLWSRSDYEEQWRESLKRIRLGEVARAMLVSDIQPRHESDAVFYWAMFAEGDKVVFQERFLRPAPPVNFMDPVQVEPFVPARAGQVSAQKLDASEWTLPMCEIADFLDQVAASE